MLAGFWSVGLVDMQTILEVLMHKGDIIVMILAFAVLAYGIKESGYFKYAAYRVLEICSGSITRLTFYMFMLTSVLTFITSNDIVILVMTPIILELCRQSRIQDAQFLLLRKR